MHHHHQQQQQQQAPGSRMQFAPSRAVQYSPGGTAEYLQPVTFTPHRPLYYVHGAASPQAEQPAVPLLNGGLNHTLLRPAAGPPANSHDDDDPGTPRFAPASQQ
uniref:Uncharacterized protein n=1 Tax=Chlamydomonas euryale TaxID=1486919 RepID=A0A7R9V547_9CHLO